MNKFKFVCAAALFFCLCACFAQRPLDYSDARLWYAVARPYDSSAADVFFVLPTASVDWVDAQGVVRHHADPFDSATRARMDAVYAGCDPIFSDGVNFVAPYYRQMTIEGWALGDSAIEARFAPAMADVRRAFDYFLAHRNPDRPFVVAGYSQGGKAAIELVKTMPDAAYRRMAAAYVVGFKITEADRASGRIVPAVDSLDTGVTVCFNSVARPEAISPALAGGTACINPLNWRADATPAPLWDTVAVSVDPAHAVLLVEGLDPMRYFRPKYAALFPCGNYHMLELTLYGPALQQNVKKRIAAFLRRK